MAGPLSQIRVLGLSRVLAGPWASLNLAGILKGMLGKSDAEIERLKNAGVA